MAEDKSSKAGRAIRRGWRKVKGVVRKAAAPVLKFLGPAAKALLGMAGPALAAIAGIAAIGVVGKVGNKLLADDRRKAEATWGKKDSEGNTVYKERGDIKNMEMATLVGERKGNRGIADVGKDLLKTTAKVVARTFSNTTTAFSDFLEKPSLTGVLNVGAGLVKDVVKGLTNPLKLISNVGYGLVGAIFGQETATRMQRWIEGKDMSDMRSELNYWTDLLNNPEKMKAAGFTKEQVEEKIKDYQKESLELVKKGGFTGAFGNMFVSAATESVRGYNAIQTAIATMTDEEIKKQFGATRQQLQEAKDDLEFEFVTKDIAEIDDKLNDMIAGIVQEKGLSFDEATKIVESGKGFSHNFFTGITTSDELLKKKAQAEADINKKRLEFRLKANAEIETMFEHDMEAEEDATAAQIDGLEEKLSTDKTLSSAERKRIQKQIGELKKTKEYLDDAAEDDTLEKYRKQMEGLDSWKAKLFMKDEERADLAIQAGKQAEDSLIKEIGSLQAQIYELPKNDGRRIAMEKTLKMKQGALRSIKENTLTMELDQINPALANARKDLDLIRRNVQRLRDRAESYLADRDAFEKGSREWNRANERYQRAKKRLEDEEKRELKKS